MALCLRNPAGIVFRPNAELDVSGAFFVSTAHFPRLEDGAVSNAVNPAASTLIVAAPAAFGFLDPNPRGITLKGAAVHVQGDRATVVPREFSVLDVGMIPIISGPELAVGLAAYNRHVKATEEEPSSVVDGVGCAATAWWRRSWQLAGPLLGAPSGADR